MKTYCKGLVIADEEKIFLYICNYMHDKWRKGSTIRFISRYTNNNRLYVKENYNPKSEFFKITNTMLAEDMAYHIKNKSVEQHIFEKRYGMEIIRYKTITDKGTQKERLLGLETILFRLYEEIARQFAAPLFSAKLGQYQCASIKGRGQNYGRKTVLKWLSSDPEGTKFMWKGDVKKCYPSIPHKRVKELLSRDLKKSNQLLYLLKVFLDLYKEFPSPESSNPEIGILIGSPISKDLCNYYLSYAYHFASEKMAVTTTRRGVTKRKRLIKHIIFFADDIVMYGGNKKDMDKAVELFTRFIKGFLFLNIKPTWVKSKSMYKDKCENTHGSILDYMGFRFHGGEVTAKDYFGKTVKHKKAWATIRRRIFLGARRKMSKFLKRVKRKIQMNKKFVLSVVSQFGWFKLANMVRYRIKNKIDKLMKIARRIVSDLAKGKCYRTEKYYGMWRRYFA